MGLYLSFYWFWGNVFGFFLFLYVVVLFCEVCCVYSYFIGGVFVMGCILLGMYYCFLLDRWWVKLYCFVKIVNVFGNVVFFCWDFVGW